LNLGTWLITIGGSPFADFTDIINPEGVEGGSQVMPIEGYGAPAPVYLNLGNLKKTQSFTITRNWSTDTLANTWYQTGVDQFAGANSVQLTHLDYEGVQTTWTITSVKITLKINAPIGCTTIETLTLEGGQSIAAA
jgi:hypothetical protein